MHSLTLDVRPDVASLSPADSHATVFLAVAIDPIAPPVESSRPPLACVLVLDVSGSMRGPPIDHVIASVERVAELLLPTDELGLVAFSHQAAAVMTPTPMDHAGTRLATARARRLASDGGTNVESGLVAAKAMLDARAFAGRRSALLLSDGEPNAGAVSAADLARVVKAMRPDISVSSLGYGVHHNEDILVAVADAGGGAYHYVPDPIACQPRFAHVLGAQADIVADALELVLAPSAGVELVRVLGHEVRFTRAGAAVPVADVTSGTRRVLVAELAVDPRAVVHGHLARVVLRYRRASDQSRQEHTRDATVDLKSGTSEIIPDVHEKVLIARAEEARRAARVLADRGQFEGAAARLRGFLAEVARAPGFEPMKGDLGEVHELLLDEAVAFERRPGLEAYSTFRKHQRSTSLDLGTSARSITGPSSVAYASRTGGGYPKAWLVRVEDGKEVGRHRLGPQCTIGRTTSAEIQVADASISRRHADVYALDGRFFIADLGSTNPTVVNGLILGSTPRRLADGDIIQMGGVSMRYEER